MWVCVRTLHCWLCHYHYANMSLLGSGKIHNIGSSMGMYDCFVPLLREEAGTVTFEVREQQHIL